MDEEMTEESARLWRKIHRLLTAQHNLALIDEDDLARACEVKAHAIWREAGWEDQPTWVLGHWAEEAFKGLESGKIVAAYRRV